MTRWSEEVTELLEDKEFLILAFTSFLSITGVSLISPALPTISQSLTVDQSRIGLVITAYTLPAIFILPFSGFLADNFGRKQVMTTGSLIIGIGGVIGFMSNDFRLLLAARVAQGIGYAGVMPLTVALLGDLYDNNMETEAQGMRSVFNRVGGILWPVVGGFLAAVSWNNVFVVYLLFFPLSIIIWRGIPRVNRHQEKATDYARSLTHIVERPRVAIYISIGFVRFFIKYSFFTYLPLLLVSRFSIGSTLVGQYMAVLSLGGLVSAATSGLFGEKFRKFNIIVITLFMTGVVTLSIAFSNYLITTLLAVALVGMADSLMGPLQKSLLTQSVDGDHRVGVVTLNSVSQNIAKTVAPVLTGSLLFLDDQVWLYIVVTVSFFSTLAYLLIRPVVQ